MGPRFAVDWDRETLELGWLQKMPLVSLLFAVSIAASPYLLVDEPAGADARFTSARAEARSWLERHPDLEVDPVGTAILEPLWVEETRETAQPAVPALSPRLHARAQARLDVLIDEAYAARIAADPTWRLGVFDDRSPGRNYVAHAFIHDREGLPAVILCVALLLLAGASLERGWGAPIYALFVLSAIPFTAQAYRMLDASSGVPWSGSAGLNAALLGAYLIRGLDGRLLAPRWALLPLWVGVEAFLVRGSGVGEIGSVPWATLCAALGFGAATAGLLRTLQGQEAEGEREGGRRESAPPPVVLRADRLRSDGDPYEAFDLIQAAWREDPSETQVAEAFFSIAVEVGQPEAAAEAILPSLRLALRQGLFDQAVQYWFPLATRQVEVSLEPMALVRLGELVLDAGHPTEALFTLRRALDAGVSPAGSARIVRIARDLDPALTRSAAKVAMSDPALEDEARAELARLVASGVGHPGSDGEGVSNSAENAEGALAAHSVTAMERRINAEHHSVDATAFPIDVTDETDSTPIVGDAETALAAEPLASEAGGGRDSRYVEAETGLTEVGQELCAFPDDGNEAALSAQNLDAGSLSAESFESAPAGEAVASMHEVPSSAEWNAPRVSDLPSLSVDPHDDRTEDEFDEDRTPLIDATDEMTHPLVASAESDVVASGRDEGARTAGPPVAGRPVASPSPLAASTASLRLLKAVEAVPVGSAEGWVEIEVEGRGKSKLPIERIEAVAMGVAEGLGASPVLIVDFLLNWSGDAAAPLKTIRIRSDRFDPFSFVASASTPVEALTRWIASIEARSGARVLPSRRVLEGAFPRFPDLETYDRDVLMAEA